jgi:hypothetical protein
MKILIVLLQLCFIVGISTCSGPEGGLNNRRTTPQPCILPNTEAPPKTSPPKEDCWKVPGNYLSRCPNITNYGTINVCPDRCCQCCKTSPPKEHCWTLSYGKIDTCPDRCSQCSRMGWIKSTKFQKQPKTAMLGPYMATRGHGSTFRGGGRVGVGGVRD